MPGIRLLSLTVLLMLAHAAAARNDAALQRASALLDLKSDFRGFFGKLTRSEAKKIYGPVLKQEAPNSSGAFLAAMVLACEGVDLKANTARVLKPALVWKENSTREFKASNGLREDAVMLEDVPRALYMIVKTQRFPPALRALLSMPSDGAVAENQDDLIMALLQEEPVTVMRLAATEKPMFHRVADTIDWNVGDLNARRAFLKSLADVRWPNRTLRRTAARLIEAVRVPIHRPAD